MKSVTRQLKWDRFEDTIERLYSRSRPTTIDAVDSYLMRNVNFRLVDPHTLHDILLKDKQ